MSMIPKGGDTIWGDLDWSPEEGYVPSKRRQRNNDTELARQNATGSLGSQSKRIYYGRMISFGKDIAEAASSEIELLDFQVRLCMTTGIQYSPDLSFMISQILQL